MIRSKATEINAAERLADRIRAYWAERGAKVDTRVEYAFAKPFPLAVVRSDMGDGLPRGFRQ